MILWKHAYWNQRFVKWYRNEIHNQFKFSNLLVRIFAPVTRGIPWYVSKVLPRDPPLNWICRFPVKWLDTNWLVYFYAFGALILISITFSVYIIFKRTLTLQAKKIKLWLLKYFHWLLQTHGNILNLLI